jgi:hypothetical protein
MHRYSRANPDDRPLIIPAVERLTVEAFGIWRRLDWKPSSGVNLIVTPPGGGATTLCEALALCGMPGDLLPELPPNVVIKTEWARGSTGTEAAKVRPRFEVESFWRSKTESARQIRRFAAAFYLAKHGQAVVCDTAVTEALDLMALRLISRIIASARSQALVFVRPPTFIHLRECDATRWRIHRQNDLEGSRLTKASRPRVLGERNWSPPSDPRDC